MHAKRMLHRDLKSLNVLLSTDDSGVMVPKLCDFAEVRCAHCVDIGSSFACMCDVALELVSVQLMSALHCTAV